MFNAGIAFAVLLTLVLLLSLGVAAGRNFGKTQLALHDKKRLEVVIVAEGAVFTLLALLIAFAFSGAYERFENRKVHIIEESNLIDTAYKRIDLLAPATQPQIRQGFRDYVDAHLAIYKAAASFARFRKNYYIARAIEDKLWTQIIIALKTTNDSSATQLFVPAVNNMFESENTGLEMTRVHPPLAIFGLLIGLAILSGFLAGYSTADSESRISLHILCYIAITAVTLYIIIDLEFPRVGLIRVDSFDRILMLVRDHMND